MWIEELERLHQIDHLILREPLPYIHVQYIFVEETEIRFVEKQLWHFSGSDKNRIIPKEKLLNLIETVLKPNYVFQELLVFHIPLEPETLTNFPSSFLSSATLDNLSLPPSLFIFHPFNTLYFIFQKKLKSVLSKGKSLTKKSVHFSKKHQGTQKTFY